ncbi:DUF1015 domain-containing protein [Dethiosulfatarculus sandiegensis]|uniref:SpoOJ/ParA/ParB/repB family protein n=1 Tax=Dethiosulfatarculus sandiegensis TaxID=1429043 RepID=A0A0D2JN23_9BACT|nr:DUF1015 domain-containing protein [Dethiosulfatarculus sandiegensis]KIX10890.1 hypothetical protein X474_27065 [Dethiosulfatarculus sandiegensis]
MAVVAPFRALRYDSRNIAGMAEVVAPPYDVVNDEQQQALYDAEPHNIIRLELNKSRDNDLPGQDGYTRAASHLLNWVEEGVLARDQKPAFYINETTYRGVNGETLVRKGFMTLLRLEDFANGVVLPHERTFTGHKEDRLRLLKATSTNISPIFALYPDEENQVHTTLENARVKESLADFTDSAGLKQSLYRVEETEALKQVQKLMADKVIFIADGHHRYETALNYRNYMREQNPKAPGHASFNYVMVYLCSMSDPGLTVFPCHRVLTHLHGFAARDFLLHAQRYFDYREMDLSGDSAKDKQAVTEALARTGEKGRGFGMVSAESDKAYILELKPGAVDDPAWKELPRELRDLDVVVLTEVILDRVLGLDANARDKEHTIEYVADMAQVLDQTRSGKSRVGFLVNPTRVEQVQAVAKSGLVMPRKTTFFYPKVITGLTMNCVDASETIPTLRE